MLACVSFPGTGKSTFIVSLVEERIPPSARVLLCTTTNKAIDSLTAKLSSIGSEVQAKLLAFGNRTRLGDTSAEYLLESRTKRHKVTELFDKMTKTIESWASRANAASARVAAGQPNPPDEAEQRANPRCLVDFEVAMRAWRIKSEARAKVELPKLTALVQGRIPALRGAFDHLDKSPVGTSEATSKARAAMESLAVALGKDEPFECVVRAIYRASSEFKTAQNKQVPAVVKRYIIQTARYFVCTAATAATIPSRIARELEHTEVASAVDELSTSLAELDVSDTKSTAPDMNFEYVVLDEAGAMLEPDVVGTIVHGCKFLLCVGDPRQLPPFTKWYDAPKHGYTQSTLERFVAKSTPSHNMMDVQYRMHPAIAELVSTNFYDGALKTAPTTAASRQRSKPLLFVDIPSGIEEKRGTSFINRVEVKAIVDIVERELLAQPPQVINVIAFHKPQVWAIKDALTAAGLNIQHDRLDVITVDAMQGREADVVVLSCVRTGDAIGFLSNENRLNVALSRAKEVLYVVGHAQALRRARSNGKWGSIVRSMT
jgi:hypothetical protein